MSNSSASGTIETFFVELSKILTPLKDILGSDQAVQLFHQIGIPLTQPQVASMSGTISGLTTKIVSLIDNTALLIDAIGDKNYSEIGKKGKDLFKDIKGIFEDIKKLAHDIDQLNIPGVDGSKIPQRIFDFVLYHYMEQYSGTNEALEFFQILGKEPHNEGSTDPNNPEYAIVSYHFDEIGNWLEDPVGTFNDKYDWGKSNFDGKKLFQAIEKVLKNFGMPVIYQETPTKLDMVLVELQPKTTVDPNGLSVFFKTEELNTTIDDTFSKDDWKLHYGMEFGITNSAELVIEPDGNVEFVMPGVEGAIFIKWTAKKSEPILLIGQPGGSRLDIEEFSIGMKSKVTHASGKSKGKLEFEMEMKKLQVFISLGQSDGFIQETVAQDSFRSVVDLLVKYSSETGFYFSGSGLLELKINTKIQLGPIEIQNLLISLGFKDSKVFAAVGATLKFALGPFTAIVENIGVKSNLTFPESGGNLGKANLDIDFKPPTGIALALDTSVVKGGGYLFFDPDNERYGGALELSINDQFVVSAIGLITTRFPDGSSGFSLLLIINVQFSPGIALGMGFFLGGLGGLIGINRTMNVEALRDGVKNNAIDHILFPENIIANIVQIISDIRAIFPPKKDQFMIGFMAKITWGVPTLLSVEFGLIIEFKNPVRIAILGVIKALLPTEEAAILKLQVNFVGIIDFEKGELSFDASLYNSKILTFTLEGDMALRIKWKNPKAFVLSVGGFHPSYDPPKHLGLKPMKRLTLTILSGNPRLVLTTYFAITSNTVQFGAAIDFSFKVSKFSVIGYFGFDVLFQFSPFRFIAGIRAGVEIKLGSSTLFSIKLEFELQGPTPWSAKGTASFKILFFKVKVRFSKTWGEDRDTTLPSVAVLPKVLEAFEQARNWSATLPPRRLQLVSLKDLELEEDVLVLQPFGSLTASQTLLPLETLISKDGNNNIADIKKVRISEVRLGSDSVAFKYVKDTFSPANYKDLSDKDKLKAPDFQDEKSGITVSDTDALLAEYAIRRKVEYEVRSSDHDWPEETDFILTQILKYKAINDRTLFAVEEADFNLLSDGGIVAQSQIAKDMKKDQFRLDGKSVTLTGETYNVVNINDLTDAVGQTFSSAMEATDALNQMLSDNPELQNQLEVIGAHELDSVFA